MDVSVVLPCLNEEEGVGICLNKIQEVFRNEGLDGEVIIVDNGCTDDTVKVVKELGFSNVRVVYEFNRGYGNAYRAGFREAKGDIVIMGDADNTYDFLKRYIYKDDSEPLPPPNYDFFGVDNKRVYNGAQDQRNT